LARSDGSLVVAVGVGESARLDAAALRDAAAAFARAASKHAKLAMTLPEGANLAPEAAAQSVVEGASLARYRYHRLKNESSATDLEALAILAPPSDVDAARAGV